MALNQNAAAGLVSMIGPCHGGRISQAQRAAQDGGDDASKLPDYFFGEAEPETTSCSAADDGALTLTAARSAAR